MMKDGSQNSRLASCKKNVSMQKTLVGVIAPLRQAKYSWWAINPGERPNPPSHPGHPPKFTRGNSEEGHLLQLLENILLWLWGDKRVRPKSGGCGVCRKKVGVARDRECKGWKSSPPEIRKGGSAS